MTDPVRRSPARSVRGYLPASPRPAGKNRIVHPLDWSRRTHGIRATYVAGCRCDDCRDAEAVYSRTRKRRR